MKAGLGVILVMLMGIVIGITAAAAMAHAQTPDVESVYFVPEDISVSGKCNSTNVAIWANTSEPLKSGRVVFDYSYRCANVTEPYFLPDPDVWDQGMVSITPGNVVVTFGVVTKPVPEHGLVHIGNFAIHCCNESYCETTLTWNPDLSYLENPDGNLIEPVYKDGTFTCTAPYIPGDDTVEENGGDGAGDYSHSTSTPTPSPSPTPAPSVTATSALTPSPTPTPPTSTPAPLITPTPTPTPVSTPEEKSGTSVPGFEPAIALGMLIAVAYLILKRGRLLKN